jgi:starch phosphorylase
MNAQEVEKRRSGYNPWDIYHHDDEIRRALDLISHDFFSMMEPGIFKPVIDALLSQGDTYMVLADLRAYIQTQDRVDAAYRDRTGWLTKTILNVARAGKFSSDRTIREYASQIWHVDPCPIGPESSTGDASGQDIQILDGVLKSNRQPI